MAIIAAVLTNKVEVVLVKAGPTGPAFDPSTPVGSITLDTINPDPPLLIAQLAWDGEDDTIQFRQNGTTLQIGQEQQWPVVDKSGITITNGRPVMATGSTGATGRINVALMDGTNVNNAKLFLGLATEEIVDNANGKVSTFGKVRNIRTDGGQYGETWIDGDLIYISPFVIGALTNIKPSRAKLDMPCAFVINAHVSSGVLAARVTPINESLLLTPDEANAMSASNAPSASNPMATMADVGGGAGGMWEYIDQLRVVGADVGELLFENFDFDTYDYNLVGALYNKNLTNLLWKWYAREANAGGVTSADYKYTMSYDTGNIVDQTGSLNSFIWLPGNLSTEVRIDTMIGQSLTGGIFCLSKGQLIDIINPPTVLNESSSIDKVTGTTPTKFGIYPNTANCISEGTFLRRYRRPKT